MYPEYGSGGVGSECVKRELIKKQKEEKPMQQHHQILKENAEISKEYLTDFSCISKLSFN